MPIESKDIIEFLGLPEDQAKDMNTLKEAFSNTFVRKDNIDDETKDRITGGAFGQATRKYRQGLTDIGVEITDAEVTDPVSKKNLKLEKVYEIGLGKIKSKMTQYESELKAAKESSGDPGKETAELQKKYNLLESQYNEVSGKFTTLNSEYETFKTSKDSEFTTYKLNNKKLEYESKFMTFPDKTPELMKTGFKSTLGSKYDFEWDEQSQDIMPIDKATKKPVAGKVAGTYKKYDEIIKDEQAAQGLIVKNNHAANQPPPPNRMGAVMSNVVDSGAVKRTAAKPMS